MAINMNNFPLPIKISKDRDYYWELNQKLRAYCAFIKELQHINDIEHLYNKVSFNCSRIKKCLELYYNAKYSKAQTLIKEYLEQYVEDNPYILTSIEESYAFRGDAPKNIQPSLYRNNLDSRKMYAKMKNTPLTFYRARMGEEKFVYKDMLHIPFNMRSKIGTYRFSIPGVPCLYLATTSYGTWIELGKPNYEEFNVSFFILPKDLKVLNLCIYQDYISGLSSLKITEKEYEAVINYLEFFPLVIATSFQITENERQFKSEYIISQLVMQSAKELGIDGVAYLSKREEDRFAYPIAVNLAILMPQNFNHNSKDELYWGRISEIQLTEPIKFSDFCNLSISKSALTGNCRSYVNECFAKGGDFEININNTKCNYYDSIFSRYDEHLANQELKTYRDM